jgi:hypothetical protein
MFMINKSTSINDILPLSAMTSIVLLCLFKPGEQYGMYDWLIRPIYVIRGSLFIDLICIIILAMYIANIIFFKRKLMLNKKSILIGFVIAISFILMQLFDMYYDGEIKSIVIKVLISFILISLSCIYLSWSILKENRIHFIFFPLVIAGVIFVIINFLIYIVDPIAVYSDISGRMYGTLEHPNFFGVTCALIFINVITYISFLSKDLTRYKLQIILLSIILIFNLYLIYLSGSRTALLTSVSALIFLYLISNISIKNKIAMVFVLAIIIIIVMLNLSLDVDGARILSDENTRSAAWLWMYNTFLEHPLFGVGMKSMAYSESSYLRPLAAYGLIGSSIYLLVVFLSLFLVYKYIVLYKYLEVNISFILIGILIGSITEGFLIETISYPSILFKYLVIYGFIEKTECYKI